MNYFSFTLLVTDCSDDVSSDYCDVSDNDSVSEICSSDENCCEGMIIAEIEKSILK